MANIQLNEFSQTEYNCIISTQIKKQNLRAPQKPTSYLLQVITHCPRVTSFLILTTSLTVSIGYCCITQRHKMQCHTKARLLVHWLAVVI